MYEKDIVCPDDGRIETRVKESIARGVELYLTKQRYSSYDIPMKDYCKDLYAAIMRDLTDGEKTVYCNRKGYSDFTFLLMTPTRTYYDNISYAYTYAELIEAVRTCTSLSEWMSRIGLLYANRIPDIDFNNAFNFWFEL